ncbi:MAG: IPT/TIG domain-containing protein [Cyclobacteriaceae bacterium]
MPFLLSAQTPGLEWARAFGAMDTEVLSMTTDAAGNVYTAGEFDGTVDFDPQSGVFNLTSAGNGDAFVSKINRDGDLVWAFRLGGIGNEGASQIEVDGTGNVYVTGVINVASGSVDFDPGPGTTLFGPGGYISKFDIDGNLLFVLPLTVNVNDIEVDAANNLFMVGTFTGTVDFDPGPSVFNHTAVGSSDFFAMSLTSAGNFVWAQRIGGSQGDTARSLALDAGGNLCITGIFFSTTVDFDPGAGTANLSITGIADVFILKLNNTGNFVWARRIGSASSEDADDIATDASDNVLITGSFSGTLDFDPGAGVANLTSVGGSDAFVLKLNSAGNYVWANSVGGSTSDSGTSITTDASEDVYYTGEFQSTTDFDPGPGIFNLSTGGGRQIFVSKLNASGSFLWALGSEANTGTPSVWAFGPVISITPTDNIIIAGELEDGTADFNPGACTTELTATSGINTFVLNLSSTATCVPTISSFTPASGPIGTTVTITGTNFSPIPANNVVAFSGVTATVSASTSTSISVAVPSGATTGTITVTVVGVTATSTTEFTVTAPGSPTITSFTPSSGPIGTTVIITGTNFDPTPSSNTVSFNGTMATVTSASATNLTVSVPVGATTGTISVSVGGNTATSITIFTVTTPTANQAPVIASSNTTTTIGAIASLDLTPLISDPDNNLDLSTLKIVSPPISGASAEIVSSTLTIDYSGISFAGTDRTTIEVCDLLASCAQQELTIEVEGDINVYTGVSPNSDLRNDIWFIQNIATLPDTRDNKVSIFNRWGDLIFETTNYDNDQRVFKGVNKNGNEVPSGIYFYKIEFASGRTSMNGYLTVKK